VGAPIGRLFYMVGASKVDKERLLAYARSRLGDSHPVMFAHCYVTRSGRAASHVSLSEEEFELRKRLGLFVMDWDEGGARCAVGTEINYLLALGLAVIVAGSDSHLEAAFNAYPDLTVIWVTGDRIVHVDTAA